MWHQCHAQGPLLCPATSTTPVYSKKWSKDSLDTIEESYEFPYEAPRNQNEPTMISTRNVRVVHLAPSRSGPTLHQKTSFFLRHGCMIGLSHKKWHFSNSGFHLKLRQRWTLVHICTKRYGRSLATSRHLAHRVLEAR